MMKYYDVVLGLIPVSFIGAFLLYLATGLPWSITIPFAGMISALIIGHALFINPPVSQPPPKNPPIRYAD